MRISKRVLWTARALIPLIGLAGLVVFTVVYVAQQQRKICGMVVLLDNRNQQLPAADEDTMRFRLELHRYRERIGC